MKNINAACLVLDFQAPEGWSPAEAAGALRAAMGDAHVSGTLSCTGAGGRRELLSWTAGEQSIYPATSPQPQAQAQPWIALMIASTMILDVNSNPTQP